MTFATLHDAHVDASRVQRGLPLAPTDFSPAQKVTFEQTADPLIDNGVCAEIVIDVAMNKALGREFSADVDGNERPPEEPQNLFESQAPNALCVLRRKLNAVSDGT